VQRHRQIAALLVVGLQARPRHLLGRRPLAPLQDLAGDAFGIAEIDIELAVLAQRVDQAHQPIA
jgi:hypothetical protein